METYAVAVVRYIDEIYEILSTRRALRRARREKLAEALARVDEVRREDQDDEELASISFVMAMLRALGRAVAWRLPDPPTATVPASSFLGGSVLSPEEEEQLALFDALIQSFDNGQLERILGLPGGLRTEQTSLLNRILCLHERRRLRRTERARSVVAAAGANNGIS